MQTLKPLPDDDAMRVAYHAHREARPHWPRDYLSAMRDPLIRAVVTLLARGLSAPVQRPIVQATRPRQYSLEAVDDAEHQREAMTPALPRLDPRAGQFHGRRQGGLDFKSLAAGEKPDEI